MKNDCRKGYAFILEGETDKEFYLAFLEYLCKKHSAKMTRIVDEDNPDIVYQLDTGKKIAIIKFDVVGSISQIPNAGSWVKTQCIQKYHLFYDWQVILCYDKDDYKPKISKFYEGDWKMLRNSLQDNCNIIDMAAAADIEDVMLKDIKGVCAFLGCKIPEGELKGSKGKAKMKNLFRSYGNTYHEGRRARPLIDNLDMEVIMGTNIIPLKELEEMLFE